MGGSRNFSPLWLRLVRPLAVDSAPLRAVSMGRVLRDELRTAMKTRARVAVDPVLAPAVGIESRGAVRTDDAQVPDPVVGRDTIDVIEGQRHRPPAPFFSKPAELTSPLLHALVEQALLKVAAMESRIHDQDLRKRCRAIARRSAKRPLRIHVVDRDAVLRDQPVERAMVAAGWSQPKRPQCLGQAARRRDRIPHRLLRVFRHTRTLVRVPDGKIDV